MLVVSRVLLLAGSSDVVYDLSVCSTTGVLNAKPFLASFAGLHVSVDSIAMNETAGVLT